MEGKEARKLTTYYEVPQGLSPFIVKVLISGDLSDRLEVPEEWQWHESFDQRVRDVLWKAADAVKASKPGELMTFSVEVPTNMTHEAEELKLTMRYDGSDYLVDLAP